METLLKDFRKKSHVVTGSDSETIAFGKKLAEELTDGDVVGFSGNLGAGKTHMIKGVAQGFSVDSSEVLSPTFGILREYHGGPFNLYHFDFYRIEEAKELDTIGFRDYMAEDDAVSLIEWPEKVPEVFDIYTYVVTIEHIDDNTRKITEYKRK